MTDTNVLRLSQPGTFTDALTEVLRLNGREPKHAAVTPLSAPHARRGGRVPCRAPRPSARGSRAASTGCSPVRPDARTMRQRSFRVGLALHATERIADQVHGAIGFPAMAARRAGRLRSDVGKNSFHVVGLNQRGAIGWFAIGRRSAAKRLSRTELNLVWPLRRIASRQGHTLHGPGRNE